jgi:cell division protein FtsI/penicillin-binding protein 2
MRVALTLVVVIMLGLFGLRAGLRLLGSDDARTELTTAQAVGDAWAAAATAGDVAGLVALVADRVDSDAVIDTHQAFLLALSTPPAVSIGSVKEQGNRGTAELLWTADLGGGATWAWTTELAVIRGGGLWSADWNASSLHPALATRWTVSIEQLPATRAPVLDRTGRALSPSGEVVEVGVQPNRLPDENRLLPEVATVLPEALAPLRELLQRQDLVGDWFYPLLTISTERADEVWPKLLGLPGMIRRDAEAGLGPAPFAAEIVGSIAATEDGGRVGVSGLEQRYDERLRGTPATKVWLVDPEGDRRELLHEHRDAQQPPLVTTLDRALQAALDRALTSLNQQVGIVVMDPATAGILAIASRPTTGYDRALEGRYPPGVLAGVVPLSAALLAGASVNDPLDCPAQGTAGGVRVTTRTPQATPSLPLLGDALTGACDVGIAQIGARLGGDALLQAVEVLGLDGELYLVVESPGFDWPATTSPAGEASASVGHARVTSSAVAAAGVAASVARGAAAVPVLLAEDVVVGPEPYPPALVSGLRTAFRAAGVIGPVQADGVRVAGLLARSGGVNGDPAPATGWWVGFVEGDGQDLAFAVVVEGDDGTRAAAIARGVLLELLSVPAA